ncbi:FtsX-like permease family protein [candidate division KSB1 bacterium]|nr:FtsX-like permease family protein [candidate division KSB1 bacterium]
MSIIKLIFKEIAHRKLNFVLSILAVLMAVAMFVAFFTMSAAQQRETIRLTRDMGFNLRIIPGETDMNDFWMTGFSKHVMPQDYVNRFLDYKSFSFAHLTATLHQKVSWHDMDIILTGISPEIEPSGRNKSSMSFAIKPGTVYVGFEIANKLGLEKNAKLELFGHVFTIAQTLSEIGSDDDIRIYARLDELQRLLKLEGKINEIKALNCLCLTSGDEDPLVILREQLNQVLPDAKVIMNKTIAVAREKQRLMFEKYFAFIMPFVIIVCAAWIGTMALLNVRDRKPEIGILRALGYESGKIAGLFLGKASLIGLVGAVLGFIAGTMLSLKYGPAIFEITARQVQPVYGLLLWSLLMAPVFAAISSFIPAIIAVTQDPAQTLREE